MIPTCSSNKTIETIEEYDLMIAKYPSIMGCGYYCTKNEQMNAFATAILFVIVIPFIISYVITHGITNIFRKRRKTL